jgi:hypothetical protein
MRFIHSRGQALKNKEFLHGPLLFLFKYVVLGKCDGPDCTVGGTEIYVSSSYFSFFQLSKVTEEFAAFAAFY